MIGREEFATLKADIEANGLRIPITILDGQVLDGRNRWLACQELGIRPETQKFGDGSPLSYIISMNLKRRHLTASQRAAIATEILPLLEKEAKNRQKQHGGTAPGREKTLGAISPQVFGKARDQAAKLFNIGGRAVSDAKRIKAKSPDLFQKVKSGEINLQKAINFFSQKKRHKERIEAAKSASLVPEILVGTFGERGNEIPDNSLSLIFTDPPYERKTSKENLSDLAKFAAKKLLQGGSLICYVGHTQLPIAMDLLRERLRYWWLIACVHSGGRTLMREYGIMAGWKPMLWFVKDTRGEKNTMVDDVVSGGREKGFHEWQQAASEAEYWIEKLCPKEGIVCDPFLGSGTTAIAAQRLHRKWIGIEADAATAQMASKRVAA